MNRDSLPPDAKLDVLTGAPRVPAPALEVCFQRASLTR